MLEFLKKCFAVNLNEYAYINVDLEINKAVLIMVIALIMSVVFVDLHRGNIRLLVLQLTRHNADSEENAKTLTELGLADNSFVKRLLISDSIITKIVTRVGAVKHGYEEYIALSKEERKNLDKIDFTSARFYIDEENKVRAEGIVEKYITSTQRTIFSCVFIAIVGACIMVAMPEILNGINLLLKSVNGK